jgi:hypothetical protein
MRKIMKLGLEKAILQGTALCLPVSHCPFDAGFQTRTDEVKGK